MSPFLFAPLQLDQHVAANSPACLLKNVEEIEKVK